MPRLHKIFLFILLNIAHLPNSLALSGMGGGMSSSISSGDFKSGISIVDPNGNQLNCEPFVDKKWEYTSYKDSWNGVYFSINAEYSSLSGDFEIEDSNITSWTAIKSSAPLIDTKASNLSKSFAGKGFAPTVTLGGGFLIDRMYLATDIEIRTGTNSFEKKVNITEGELTQEYKLNIDLRTSLFFNAKIGYLISDRFLMTLNAGLGSLSNFNITSKDYSVDSSNDSLTSPPIKLGLGMEMLLSNHFRLISEFAYWVIPDTNSSFIIRSKTESYNASENPFKTSMSGNSFRLGILYRF